MATERETQAQADRQLCGLVNGLANHIEAHVRVRAATLGLTAAQGTALAELTRPMTLRELAERMSCEPLEHRIRAVELQVQAGDA